MKNKIKASKELRCVFCLPLLVLGLLPAARAQEPIDHVGLFREINPPRVHISLIPVVPRPSLSTHRFWDRTNNWWFAGVGAARAFDYASTLNVRRRGINEAFLTNSIVDNHPLFAGIEAAATATSIGVSYLFHSTGHHKLERWTSIIHFGLTLGGAVRNYSLKTPH